MLYNKGSLSGLLKPGFSKCAFLYAWTLWECCPPTLENVMKTALWRVCRPLSPLKSKFPVSPYHLLDGLLLSPALSWWCMLTHVSPVYEVILFRYLSTAWRFISGKDCALPPPTQPPSPWIWLSKLLKVQQETVYHQKDPEAFTTTTHQIKYLGRLPSETDTPSPSKKKKIVSSFRKWTAIVKTDRKVPCIGAVQAAARVSTAVGCWVHMVFLRHH